MQYKKSEQIVVNMDELTLNKLCSKLKFFCVSKTQHFHLATVMDN